MNALHAVQHPAEETPKEWMNSRPNAPALPANKSGAVLQRPVRFGRVLELLQTPGEEFQKNASASRSLHSVPAVRTVIKCVRLDPIPASAIGVAGQSVPTGSTFPRRGIRSRARPASSPDPPDLPLPRRQEAHASSVCPILDRQSGWTRTRCATRLWDTVAAWLSCSAQIEKTPRARPVRPVHRILHAVRPVLAAPNAPAPYRRDASLRNRRSDGHSRIPLHG